jgi:hypothetical protein
MGNNKVKKPHETKSVIRDYVSQKSSIKDLAANDTFVLSLKHLDKTQGSSMYDWEKNRMLALTMETLGGYCNLPLKQQFSEKFTLYGDFPVKSKFKPPSYVPQDANWARIHINGTHVVAGHIFHNTFYIVFFDHDHTFYISEKKNT